MWGILRTDAVTFFENIETLIPPQPEASEPLDFSSAVCLIPFVPRRHIHVGRSMDRGALLR